MDSSITGELILIAGLILANGFFAAAELAIVAAKRGRLKALADQGDIAARTALDLAQDPDRFLSAVQVGITVVGTCAAVVGGASLVTVLSKWLTALELGVISRRSEAISLAVVVAGISFLSIVVGELVPKRLALADANRLARMVARPMAWMMRLASPFVWLLSRTTDLLLAPLGLKQASGPSVSIDDIQHMMEQAAAERVVTGDEMSLASSALRLGDRTARDIMRPRTDIDALDVNTPAREVLGALSMAGFSKLPVYDGDLDHIIGHVHLRDVVRQQYLGWKLDLKRLIQPILFVPETLHVDRLLALFRDKHTHIAVVVDEFGGTEGIITLEDLLADFVGTLAPHQTDQQRLVRRDDGSWLVDGSVSVDDLVDELGLKPALFPFPRPFSTVAGMVLHETRRIPSVGDKITWGLMEAEVVDMDGPRIDRLLIAVKDPAAYVRPPVPSALESGESAG
jgi:putative hemolysin